MTIQLQELTREETMSSAECKDAKGGFFFYNPYYQPHRYNSFYQPVLPLNTFAGGLNNAWAIRGAAFDRSFDSWLANF